MATENQNNLIIDRTSRDSQRQYNMPLIFFILLMFTLIVSAVAGKEVLAAPLFAVLVIILLIAFGIKVIFNSKLYRILRSLYPFSSLKPITPSNQSEGKLFLILLILFLLLPFITIASFFAVLLYHLSNVFSVEWEQAKQQLNQADFWFSSSGIIFLIALLLIIFSVKHTNKIKEVDLRSNEKKIENEEEQESRKILEGKAKINKSGRADSLIINHNGGDFRGNAINYYLEDEGDRLIIRRKISKLFYILMITMTAMSCYCVFDLSKVAFSNAFALIPIPIFLVLGLLLGYILLGAMRDGTKPAIIDKSNGYYWEGDIENFSINNKKCENIILLSNVTALRIMKSKNRKQSDEFYYIMLVLKDGYSNNEFIKKIYFAEELEAAKRAAVVINEFLNVPIIEKEETVDDLISDIS